MQAAPQSLHDAAKAGDEEGLKRLIEEGKDVNEKDRRGITALGVAVGFNRTPCIRALHLTDARGSTVLHYAAGATPSHSPGLGIQIQSAFDIHIWPVCLSTLGQYDTGLPWLCIDICRVPVAPLPKPLCTRAQCAHVHAQTKELS